MVSTHSSFGQTYWRLGRHRAFDGLVDAGAVDDPAYRDVADNLPTLCWIANADGYITWYNRRWHEYCGTTPEQMEGWGWQSVHDPDVLPEVMARWKRSIASGEPFEMVFPLRGADGAFRPFLTRIIPLHDDAGVLRRWIGNNIDISPQVAIEQELRRSREELEASNRALVERESFLSSVLASSTDCIKVLDLEGRLTFMSEGGQRVMEVSDFNDIAGCPWPDFWQDAGYEEAKACVASANKGEARSFIGKANTFTGKPKWWHVVVSPIPGPDGKPQRILSVSRDITEMRASEEDRDRFVRLAENSSDFVGMMDTDSRVFYLNGAARRLVGIDSSKSNSRSISDFLEPEDAQKFSGEVLPAVERDGHWAGEINLRHFVSDEAVPVLSSVFAITDATGALIGFGTVMRDYRVLKRAENDLRFLNGELAHRLKNVLALVQSVAQQTLRNAHDTATASQALSARLVALGAATDVLTSGSWKSADLLELATRTLAPHGAIGSRIMIDGPVITLKAEVTIAFALALHELATNAAKYGALSNDVGTVHLNWKITGAADNAQFSMIWRELGGPRVTPPARTGFGSILIERSLRSYLNGSAATSFDPEGLVFTLQARLDVTANQSGI